MKLTVPKKILTGITAVLLAGGVLFAQTQSPSSGASDEVETSFTNMTEGERVAKLQELKAEQVAKGNTKAADYLQGRIDFLNN